MRLLDEALEALLTSCTDVAAAYRGKQIIASRESFYSVRGSLFESASKQPSLVGNKLQPTLSLLMPGPDCAVQIRITCFRIIVICSIGRSQGKSTSPAPRYTLFPKIQPKLMSVLRRHLLYGLTAQRSKTVRRHHGLPHRETVAHFHLHFHTQSVQPYSSPAVASSFGCDDRPKQQASDAIQMLTSGFDMTELRLLSIVRTLQKERFVELSRGRIPVKRTYSNLMGIADPTGQLAPDEVMVIL